MGCLKLTYRSGTPTLKVVWNSLKDNQKGCTGAYRFGFNSQESDPEISGTWGTHYTAEFWMYDARVNRRWNVDPRPVVSISPYATFANNPIIFTDHLGDTVRIDAGEGYVVDYTPGMEYEGTNDFVKTNIKVFDEMHNRQGGDKVLNHLVSSESVYTIVNEQGGAGAESLGFSKNEGGATIKAAALMNYSLERQVPMLGHEMFHGYQLDRGQDPFSIDSEVGAILFELSMSSAFIYMSGQDVPESNVFSMAMDNLLIFSDEFSVIDFHQAVGSFKKGSGRNLPNPKYPKGPYSKFDEFFLDSPVIKDFFPLTK